MCLWDNKAGAAKTYKVGETAGNATAAGRLMLGPNPNRTRAIFTLMDATLVNARIAYIRAGSGTGPVVGCVNWEHPTAELDLTTHGNIVRGRLFAYDGTEAGALVTATEIYLDIALEEV